MSTRSNILIIKKDSDNKFVVTQYYHHCDGYLEGVGEELRLCAVTGVGFSAISNEELDVNIKKLLSENSQYEQEDNYDFSEKDGIHGDIEYLYVLDIKDDGVLYKCYDVPIFTNYDIETLENCELVETMFINYKKHQEPD
jgi:hypothetical protein